MLVADSSLVLLTSFEGVKHCVRIRLGLVAESFPDGEFERWWLEADSVFRHGSTVQLLLYSRIIAS